MKILNHIILGFLILSGTLLSSCFMDCEKGSGLVVEEERELPEFFGIDVIGSGDLYIKQGDEQSVRIETDDNLISMWETYVRGGKLIINTKGCIVKPTKQNIYVTVENLEQITVSGSSEVFGDGKIRTNKLELKVSGSGEINMSVQVNDLETDISGSGKANLGGTAIQHLVHISGSGDVHAYKLQTEESDVKISGSGEAEVLVNKKLSAKVSGSGNVFYKGGPKVKTRISGSGTVNAVD